MESDATVRNLPGAPRPSKAALLRALEAFDWRAIDAMLTAKPALAQVRDDKGRTWLHLLGKIPLRDRGAGDSIKTADVLIAHGLAFDDPATVEDGFWASPLWHAIAFSRNLVLAEHFLKLGAKPHGFYAAAWNDDVAAIDLLVRYGAKVEEPHAGNTPFIEAVGWDRFAAAGSLARHGANVDAQDARGRTALHMLLERGRPFEDVAQILRLGANLDAPGRDGRTARQVMSRKKDARFRTAASAEGPS